MYHLIVGEFASKMKRLTPLSVLACIGIMSRVDAFTSVQQTTTRTSHSRLYNSDTQEKKAYFVDESEIPNAKVKVQVQVKEEESSAPSKEQEELSDLDARVLRSMLQDDKLDLKQEANMKKLLERGVAPKSAPSFEKEPEEKDDDSAFSSTLFKVSQ